MFLRDFRSLKSILFKYPNVHVLGNDVRKVLGNDIRNQCASSGGQFAFN